MNETVTQLTNRLIASYAQVGGINHLDAKNLPSKRVIAEITENLLRLLFPGFFDERLIHSSELKVVTATHQHERGPPGVHRAAPDAAPS